MSTTVFDFERGTNYHFALVGNVIVEGYVTNTFPDGIEVDNDVYIPEHQILFFKKIK